METEEMSAKLDVETIWKGDSIAIDSSKELTKLTINDSIDDENTLSDDNLKDIMSNF